MAWWLIPPVLIAVGAWLLSDEEDEKMPAKAKLTTLEENFLCLHQKLQKTNNQKRILIVGQPGAGKSSLLTKVTDGLCEPKPIVGQQTDATHWHDSIREDFFHTFEEKIFVDSPGYDTRHHPVYSYEKHFPFSSFDVIMLVLSGKVHHSDQKVFSKLERIANESSSRKIVVVRSFSEDLTEQEKNEIEQDLNEQFGLSHKNIEFVFASSRTGDGIRELKTVCKLHV